MDEEATREALLEAIRATHKSILALQDVQRGPGASQEIGTSIFQLETAEMWLEKAVQSVR